MHTWAIWTGLGLLALTALFAEQAVRQLREIRYQLLLMNEHSGAISGSEVTSD